MTSSTRSFSARSIRCRLYGWGQSWVRFYSQGQMKPEQLEIAPLKHSQIDVPKDGHPKTKVAAVDFFLVLPAGADRSAGGQCWRDGALAIATGRDLRGGFAVCNR